MIIPEKILNKLSKRTPEQITSFYIHHGANDSTETLQEVNDEEVSNPTQGFLCIGYNAVIREYETGKYHIEEARPLIYVPAAQQDRNETGYALCVFGNYGENEVPDEVIPLIIERINNLKLKCKNLKYLQSHSDASRLANDPSVSTLCCGKFLIARLHEITTKTGLVRL